MNKWFIVNKLNLNTDKKNVVKFLNEHITDMNINYCIKSVQEAKTTKFLSFQIHSQINKVLNFQKQCISFTFTRWYRIFLFNQQ